MRFAAIDQCPCPVSVAPYVYLVLRRAGQTASSVYRGEDAKALLHRYGKHTQAEIHAAMPAISNPPGFSQHELRSDGVGNPRVPRGGVLEEWQVGVDSGSNSDADKERINTAARHYGWTVKHPYSRGVEGHHWCFAVQPKPKSLGQRARIIALRAQLAVQKAKPKPQPTRISDAGLTLISSFEGWVDHVYKDPVGIPTIGYGHVVRPGEHWPAHITKAAGIALLRRDAASAEAAVRKGVKVRLSQGQFDALVCFAFNVGNGALLSSTLLRKLNAGDYRTAADEFLRWDKAGGKQLAGLTRRRQAERALFLR